jgi:Protein of unknown function (DUF3951)
LGLESVRPSDNKRREMNQMDVMAIGFPSVIVILVLISFYKVFIKKKGVTPMYTPFDEITGQTEVLFHEEHDVLAEDEDQGEDLNKWEKKLRNTRNIEAK